MGEEEGDRIAEIGWWEGDGFEVGEVTSWGDSFPFSRVRRLF